MSEIGFAERYREQMRLARRAERTVEHWDARAAHMSEGAFDGSYVRQFVVRMNLEGCATLLDVGCGPGTIGLSVAARLEHVYGLDFSPGMLAALAENARSRGLANVTALQLAWEDDWSEVPTCDVVVASRSVMVPDLESALLKLHSRARVRAYVTYPADGSVLPAAVRRAIGRGGNLLPDYLSVAGILHDLGFYPTLDYLPAKNRLASCTTFEALHAKVSESLGALSDEESTRLRSYYDANQGRVGLEPMRWALFSWEAREQTAR